MKLGCSCVEPPTRLALLRRLTDLEPRWLVWKNSDGAVTGPGDVDSAAPRDAWPRIIAEFRAWATTAGFGPTIACVHAPGLLVLVACVGTEPMRLFQLDVYEQVSAIAPANALTHSAQVDPRGFRRLRPGAEGLLRLVGVIRRPARPPRDQGEVARIAELMRSDLEGAERAASDLGRVGRSALAGAKSLLDGAWSYRAMLTLEIALLAHGMRDPRRRAAWLRFRLSGGASCPVLAALAAGRAVPGEPEQWLTRVRHGHDVV